MSQGKLNENRNLMWTKRGKARLILIFSTNTNCENMAYRSFRSEKYSARGVRKGVSIWNQLPAAMIVRFDAPSEWQIEGLPPKTLPIAPIRTTWYLDSGRMNPQLAISRRQFPLAQHYKDQHRGRKGRQKPPSETAKQHGVAGSRAPIFGLRLEGCEVKRCVQNLQKKGLE